MRDGHGKENDSPVFSSNEMECVWMTAKVVNFKLCERDRDCANCPFDKAMKQAWNQGNEETGTPS